MAFWRLVAARDIMLALGLLGATYRIIYVPIEIVRIAVEASGRFMLRAIRARLLFGIILKQRAISGLRRKWLTPA